MLKIGKANSIKATKLIRETLMEFGAIEMTNNWGSSTPLYRSEGALGFVIPKVNSFLMETKAGLLWLYIDCNADSHIYTVFARFDNVELANKVLANNTRLNRSSGKFNFHYNNLDSLIHGLEELIDIIPDNRKVLTHLDDLSVDYDANSIILVCGGDVVKGQRYTVDDAKIWRDEFSNWRGKKVLVVDGFACLISKSTVFQLIIDGELKNPK